jgi:hypothetical protein
MEIHDLIAAIVMLGIGALILLKAEWLVRNAIKSDDVFSGRIGIPRAPESSQKWWGMIIVKIMGWGSILFGLFQVETLRVPACSFYSQNHPNLP